MRYTSGLPNSLELYEIDLPYGEGGNSSLRKGPSSRKWSRLEKANHVTSASGPSGQQSSAIEDFST